MVVPMQGPLDAQLQGKLDSVSIPVESIAPNADFCHLTGALTPARGAG
jgi:hypothetical protein